MFKEAFLEFILLERLCFSLWSIFILFLGKNYQLRGYCPIKIIFLTERNLVKLIYLFVKK